MFGYTATSPFRPVSATRRANDQFEAAGLPRMTLHEARHCFASRALAAGMQPKVVQVLMGHSSIVVTLDIYGHLVPGAHDEAGALLTEAFA